MSFSGQPDFNNQTKVCLVLPPKVHSPGLLKGLAEGGEDDWLDYSFPRVELIMGLVFFISQACHYTFKHLGFPLYTSQLIVRFLQCFMFFN